MPKLICKVKNLTRKQQTVLTIHEHFLKEFKPRKSVHLIFNAIEGAYGFYDYKPKNKLHKIYIDMKNSELAIIDVLIHEWAHLLQKNKASRSKYSWHSNDWGKQYSRVYRSFLKLYD